jgi:hypothetical protein
VGGAGGQKAQEGTLHRVGIYAIENTDGSGECWLDGNYFEDSMDYLQAVDDKLG